MLYSPLAEVAELADARDLKSREHCARGGSIPPLGILHVALSSRG